MSRHGSEGGGSGSIRAGRPRAAAGLQRQDPQKRQVSDSPQKLHQFGNPTGGIRTFSAVQEQDKAHMTEVPKKPHRRPYKKTYFANIKAGGSW